MNSTAGKKFQEDYLEQILKPEDTENLIKGLLGIDGSGSYEVAKLTNEELQELFADDSMEKGAKFIGDSKIGQGGEICKMFMKNGDIQVLVSDKIATIFSMLTDKERLRIDNFMFLLDSIWGDGESFDEVKNDWFEILMKFIDFGIANNIQPDNITRLFECFHDENFLNNEFYNYLINTLNNIYGIIIKQDFSQEDLNRLVHIIEYSIKDGGLMNRLDFITAISNREHSFSDALSIQCEILNT
ncbi:MAG: hypothetical protein V3575_02915 [Candidatus Absconditabacteria bacterium]